MRAAVAVRLAAGRAAGIAKRIAVKEAGMTWAKAWRAEHHPVACTEHMPFAGHRTCAQVFEDEERETLLEKLEREQREGER